MSISVVYNQLVFLGRPGQPISLAINIKPPLLRLQLERRGGLFSKTAASSSFTGSGAEYAGPVLGAEKKKKKKEKIAGVDQDELVDPTVLADPDSCFCEFKGVQIHHKICDAESEGQNLSINGTSPDFPHHTKKVQFPLILLHGFGASLFSWNAVMKALAKVSGSKVLSFDRPAFGLTSRLNPSNHSSHGSEDAKPLNPYSMAFSVLATLYFISFLAAEKAILVGHSAGCLVAVQTYLQAPERVAAMILIAPTIVAPLTSPKILKENDHIQEDGPSSDTQQNPIIMFFSILSKLSRYIVQAISNLVTGMANMLSSLFKKVLSAFLHSSIAAMLVRMVIDKFGIPGIRNAWYDASKITDAVLDGYIRPLRTKGWDRALLDYTAAMLTDSVPETKPPLPKRLKEISCPVLIVTGDSDRLVPSWNAERLSQAIPGSSFEIIKNCGHVPQEEKPEEFMSIVDKFLRSIFGGIEAQQLQAAT